MISATINSTSATRGLIAKAENVKAMLRREMKGIGVDLQGYIKTNKLSGEPLNRRTGNLSRSQNEELIEDADSLTTVVGTRNTAPYGKVHEFGGTFEIPEHISHSKLGTPFSVKAHSATFPERSYSRTALAEKKAEFLQRIGTTVNKAVKA